MYYHLCTPGHPANLLLLAASHTSHGPLPPGARPYAPSCSPALPPAVSRSGAGGFSGLGQEGVGELPQPVCQRGIPPSLLRALTLSQLNWLAYLWNLGTYICERLCFKSRDSRVNGVIGFICMNYIPNDCLIVE